jgi:hypothetical protein
MNDSLPVWSFQSSFSLPEMAKANHQLPVASHCLAAIGKGFLPSKENDSQTNMGWFCNHGLITHDFSLDQSYRFRLNYQRFRLDLLSGDDTLMASWSLDGRDKQELYKELNTFFAERQTITQTYAPMGHYQIPEPETTQYELARQFLLEGITAMEDILTHIYENQ